MTKAKMFSTTLILFLVGIVVSVEIASAGQSTIRIRNPFDEAATVTVLASNGVKVKSATSYVAALGDPDYSHWIEATIANRTGRRVAKQILVQILVDSHLSGRASAHRFGRFGYTSAGVYGRLTALGHRYPGIPAGGADVIIETNDGYGIAYCRFQTVSKSTDVVIDTRRDPRCTVLQGDFVYEVPTRHTGSRSYVTSAHMDPARGRATFCGAFGNWDDSGC